MSDSTTIESAPPIVRVRGVEKHFGTLRVLDSIDMDVERGTLVSIVGASGAGKTTLLQIVGTLMQPDSGSIEIGGVQIDSLRGKTLAKFRNEEIGFVFQFHHLLPELSAADNVCIPALIGRQRYAKARRRAEELLAFLGLEERLNHKPQQLSGGEQQRVAIARALMNEPKIVLADEPSGNLDSYNKEELHNLFFTLRDELGQTFIIVTHDEHLAARSDRIARIVDGRMLA